jgi:hypothetical protein
MPLIQGQIGVPANGVIDNVLTGSQFEFLPYDASLRFGMTGATASLLADVYSGQDVLAEQMLVPGTNRVPINPDDFSLFDVAGAGERIKIRVRNPTGATVQFLFSVVIDPL